MSGIDAHKAGPSLGTGRFAHADRVAHRTGLGEGRALRLIAGALAQVVQVRHRQVRQTLAAGIVLVPVRPQQKVGNGRSADVFIGLIHLDEQPHVKGRVFARKRCSKRTVAFGQGHLGQTVTLPSAGAEKLLELLDRRQPCFVHVDHHPGNDQPSSHFTRISLPQAHSWVEIHASFRLIPRWTRLELASSTNKKYNGRNCCKC